MEITNTGGRAGKEVVQLYIRDKVSSVTTLVKRLKAFKKVNIEPGETEKIDFTVDFDELSLWNQEMKKVVEPGDFEVMIGSSSENIRLKGEFTVVK